MTHQRDDRSHFVIESCDVRGQVVRLDDAWRAARARTEYPATVAQVLGEAFVATALLAGTIKFDGKLTLQVRGTGHVYLLVVQITNDGKLRGLARWNEVPSDSTLQQVFGEDAQLTITIEPDSYSEPYQGIVPLVGESLADAVSHYFATSEQLKTTLHFAVSVDTAAGLLLQALPTVERQTEDADGWNRATTLAATVTPEELCSVSVEELLQRLYHEEQVRLMKSTSLQFHCSCSRERTDGLLEGLGYQEVIDIVKEQGQVDIHCEFCDAHYRYDAIDVEALFKGSSGAELPSETQH